MIKALLYKQCPTCKGKGYTVEDRITLCVTCLGSGAIRSEAANTSGVVKINKEKE